MDVEYYGPNPQMQAGISVRCAQVEEMARHLGDADSPQPVATCLQPWLALDGRALLSTATTTNTRFALT
jgi:hypothetical protein